jgi:hypothetical protein
LGNMGAEKVYAHLPTGTNSERSAFKHCTLILHVDDLT